MNWAWLDRNTDQIVSWLIAPACQAATTAVRSLQDAARKRNFSGKNLLTQACKPMSRPIIPVVLKTYKSVLPL